MKESEDAFGRELFDYLQGIDVTEIIERIDGNVDVSGGAAFYFSTYPDWSHIDKKAMGWVHGRVLDIGCGAGRHSLYLQEKGYEVVAIDQSPLAVEVCKQRGVKQVHVMPVTKISSKLGSFDTIIMMGNNFGLMENPRRAKWLLKKFHALTSEKGRLIAATLDPYNTEDPLHLAYHERNRKQNRLPGMVRIRVRYRIYKSPWFNYLFVSQEEMDNLLVGTGWQVSHIISEADEPQYAAVIEKSG